MVTIIVKVTGSDELFWIPIRELSFLIARGARNLDVAIPDCVRVRARVRMSYPVEHPRTLALMTQRVPFPPQSPPPFVFIMSISASNFCFHNIFRKLTAIA